MRYNNYYENSKTFNPRVPLKVILLFAIPRYIGQLFQLSYYCVRADCMGVYDYTAYNQYEKANNY